MAAGPARDDKDARKANKRGAARLAAVQALYQMDLAGTGLNEILAERQPLYNHLCGSTISVEMRLGEDLDLVLNHALHLEKLALNLILSAKHSMPYGGKIVVGLPTVLIG